MMRNSELWSEIVRYYEKHLDMMSKTNYEVKLWGIERKSAIWRGIVHYLEGYGGMNRGTWRNEEK